MIQGIGATADRIFRCHPRSRRQDNPRRHPPWRQAGRIPLQCRHVGLRQGHRAAACGRIISANRRRRDLRRQAGAGATARYRHCISGLQQGAAAMTNRCRQRLAGAGGLARRLFPDGRQPTCSPAWCCLASSAIWPRLRCPLSRSGCWNGAGAAI